MVDDIYSVSLLIALVSGGFCAVLSILARWRPQALGARSSSARRLAPGLLVVSVLAGSLSLGVHGFIGHGATSAEPMGLVTFASQHKGYWSLPLLWLACFVLRPGRTAA